jgi:2,4-dienoyl-CoA reductase-like NADH-dependent reductase (Old Yellow Enzyme family)
MEDTYQLLDAIIPAGVDYVHASLFSVLESKPMAGGDKTIAELVVEYVTCRVPVIAAGQLRTPEQATVALARGLPLAAVGQGLVMNPDWVEQALAGHADRIETSLKASAVTALAIPKKLWAIIDATTGWFAITRTPTPVLTTADALTP